MGNKYSDETRRQFAELRAKGYTYPELSKELGISVRTAQTWAKEMTEEIATAHADYITETLQEYIKAKRDRINSLQVITSAIDTAILEIDLKKVPPEKLLKLKLEYESAINREYIGAIGNETARDKAYTARTEAETELASARVDKIHGEQTQAEMYEAAIKAMKRYTGHGGDIDE